ncbi:MAG: hypothetical protein Q7S20_02815 [Gemmatimonadaceae bacterium]|nr:hypothetical protein [Gemmatimonadaceae bacterium]
MAQSVEVISHWHQSVEGLSTSTLDYYAAVEKALRDKEVPELQIERITASESGILSAKREYLRARYGRLSFDICGAPFGKDFFFSWWLVKRIPGFAALWGCASLVGLSFLTLVFIGAMGFFKGILFALVAVGVGTAILRGAFADGWSAIEDTILVMPIIGLLYKKFVNPVTYYSEDTRLMFEDTVHRVVVQVVEGILTINKLPEIPAEKLKPQSRSALS